MKIDLYTGFQGFCLGAIAMAYVYNYNRRQLLIAITFLTLSIISRLLYKK